MFFEKFDLNSVIKVWNLIAATLIYVQWKYSSEYFLNLNLEKLFQTFQFSAFVEG